jgi:uncharacterized protein with HEPN domain
MSAGRLHDYLNRIVHAYSAIDWQYVWDTVHKDFPKLIDAISLYVYSDAAQNTDPVTPAPPRE